MKKQRFHYKYTAAWHRTVDLTNSAANRADLSTRQMATAMRAGHHAKRTCLDRTRVNVDPNSNEVPKYRWPRLGERHALLLRPSGALLVIYTRCHRDT